ncbi:arginase [bacterium]|nr:arginase [bacterium]
MGKADRALRSLASQINGSVPRARKSINILGFPMDLGAGRRGVDMGPSALRIAGLGQRLRELGYDVDDQGDILVRWPRDRMEHEKGEHQPGQLHFLPEIAESCGFLASSVQSILEDGGFPLVLGGDHSMSIGTLAGVASHCRVAGKRLGVLWVDAHADINTPQTSPSGNIHGMPVGVCLGMGAEELTNIGGFSPKLMPENIVYIGLRSVDSGEKSAIATLGIEAYPMPEIDKHGLYSILQKALPALLDRVDHLHVSFDLDSIDPDIAPGVGTPVKGGLSYREAHLLMEWLHESGRVDSFEVAEVNPVLDERNRSAELAVELLCSVMGLKILL